MYWESKKMIKNNKYSILEIFFKYKNYNDMSVNFF